MFEKLKRNYFLVFAVIILIFGCGIRLFRLERSLNGGLQQDEASIGYEAYAISHFGTDRNGNSYPVHLVAWGSGQNALYAYLVAPFISILDNEILAIRLPMALAGCLTLMLCFIFIKGHFKNKLGLMALFILAVFPWHFLKSRWGLESQIFPDIFLWGLIALYYGLEKGPAKKGFRQHWYFVVAAVLFGISTYAYGPAYCFIPVFLVLTYGYFVITKKLKLIPAVVYFGITGIVALPMVLFVLINYLGWDSIQVGAMTIPRLDYNRFTAVTSLGGNFFETTKENLKLLFSVVYTGTGGYIFDYIPNFGVLYMFYLPFAVYGLVLSLKNFKKKLIYPLNLFYLIAALMVGVLVDANVTRINVLWFCLLIYALIGLFDLVKNKTLFYWSMTGVYLVSAGWMLTYYRKDYQEAVGGSAFAGLVETIKKAEETEHEKLYITGGVNMPYIYYLLATKMSPEEYIAGRVIPERETMFQQVTQIGETYFGLPEKIEAGNVYIMNENEVAKYNLETCETWSDQYYTLVTNCASD